eukprot:gene3654-4589_t
MAPAGQAEVQDVAGIEVKLDLLETGGRRNGEPLPSRWLAKSGSFMLATEHEAQRPIGDNAERVAAEESAVEEGPGAAEKSLLAEEGVAAENQRVAADEGAVS